jgi:hypothetical protein
MVRSGLVDVIGARCEVPCGRLPYEPVLQGRFVGSLQQQPIVLSSHLQAAA